MGFLTLRVGFDHADFLAGAGPRETLLVEPPFVVSDQAVGGRHDGLRGTVVLLQAEFPGLGIILLETEDVFDAGTPESVDALRIVAHDADVVVRFGEPAQDEV